MEIAIVGVEVDVTQRLEAPCPGIIVLPGILSLVLLEEGFELTFDRRGFYALAEAEIKLLVAGGRAPVIPMELLPERGIVEYGPEGDEFGKIKIAVILAVE